jgi:DNA-binding MarR family transcriptional regulator
MERRCSRPGARRRRRHRRIWEPIGEAQFLCSYWLNRAETRVSSLFAKKLKDWDLISSEWAALREMYRPGRTSSVCLAQVLGMTKGGASKMIDRLVRKGFASRSVGKLDRRCRPVRLTRRGRDLVVHLAVIAERHDGELFRNANLRYHLMRALKRVVTRVRQKEWADRHMRSVASMAYATVNMCPETVFYYPGAAPPPSAATSNHARSWDPSVTGAPESPQRRPESAAKNPPDSGSADQRGSRPGRTP